MIVAIGTATAQKAKVYFISSSEIQTGVKSFGNIANRYLEMDGKNICGLSRNGLYGVIEVEPGDHDFSTVYKNQKPGGAVNVKLEAGEKYYFAYFSMQPIWELMPTTGERLILQNNVQKVNCSDILKEK